MIYAIDYSLKTSNGNTYSTGYFRANTKQEARREFKKHNYMGGRITVVKVKACPQEG